MFFLVIIDQVLGKKSSVDRILCFFTVWRKSYEIGENKGNQLPLFALIKGI